MIAKAKGTPKTELAQTSVARARAAHKAELASAEAARRADVVHKAELARAERAHKVELARAEAARVQAAKAAAHQVELARAAKAAKQEQLRLAKAAAEQKQLAQAKAARAEQVRLARAEARDRAAAKAQALAQAQARADARERIQLTSLTRPPAHPASPPAPPKKKPAPQTAKLDHKAKAGRNPKVERATLKAHKPPLLVTPSARGRAAQTVPLPQPGLMKVSTPRVDPSMGAADRQMARAYQGARAAGVSDDQLQLQQARWAAARSAAAREAPWAMHDVYLAHIAELNGLARDAHAAGH